MMLEWNPLKFATSLLDIFAAAAKSSSERLTTSEQQYFNHKNFLVNKSSFIMMLSPTHKQSSFFPCHDDATLRFCNSPASCFTSF